MTDISTKSDVSVTNMIGSASVDAEINLDELYKFLQNSDDYPAEKIELDKKPPVGIRFYADYDDVDIPLVTFHRKGKYVVKGATSLEEIQHGHNLGVSIFDDTDLVEHPKDVEFSIDNIVAQDRIKIDKDLVINKLDKVFEKRNNYEGEIYPAFVYNPEDEGWSVLIYRNGKIIISGCKSVTESQEVSKHVKTIINDNI